MADDGNNGDKVQFELRLAAQLTPSKVKAPAPADTERAQRRHVQDTARRAMEPFYNEMVFGLVYDFRQSKDLNHRFKIAKYFIDQIAGSPKPLTEEEKKGADAGSILDILAAMSTQQGAIEREGRETPVLTHTPAEQAAPDVGTLLDQFKDAEDGEIIDG